VTDSQLCSTRIGTFGVIWSDVRSTSANISVKVFVHDCIFNCFGVLLVIGAVEINPQNMLTEAEIIDERKCVFY
jgi:hypothetical protein